MELPAAYLSRMRAQLGAEGYAAYLAAMALAPCRALRVNTLKSAPEELSQLLGAPLARCEGAADGFFLPEGVQPGRHPAHLAGLLSFGMPYLMPFVKKEDGGGTGEGILRLPFRKRKKRPVYARQEEKLRLRRREEH